MPKLKKTDEERANEALTALIEYKMDLYGISKESLARKIDRHWRTVYTRFERPGSWTLEELRAAQKALHMTNDEIMGGGSKP